MSGNNGNGNGHREYERADTPPSDRFLPDSRANAVLSALYQTWMS